MGQGGRLRMRRNMGHRWRMATPLQVDRSGPDLTLGRPSSMRAAETGKEIII